MIQPKLHVCESLFLTDWGVIRKIKMTPQWNICYVSSFTVRVESRQAAIGQAASFKPSFMQLHLLHNFSRALLVPAVICIDTDTEMIEAAAGPPKHRHV
jgi:hypothetical protein